MTRSGQTRVSSAGMAPWLGLSLIESDRPFGLEAARRYCRSLAESHYENFPVFLTLFGPEERDALAAIYAFARMADDFGDEPGFDGVRERLLDVWEKGARIADHLQLDELGHAQFARQMGRADRLVG